MSMTVIEHIEVGSGGAASITFSAIPDIYTDLLVVLSARTTQAVTNWSDVVLTFNGSSSNYTSRVLYGTGSTATTLTETSSIRLRTTPASVTANTFGTHSVVIPNYAGSAAKSVSINGVGEANQTTAFQYISASLWNDTSPITSLSFTAGVGLLVEYSSATLYGITAGSDGTTVVS
jgi:hypothetical protein